MIPDFNDDGYLPPGVHAATPDEVAARFGSETELRRVQMQSLNWLIDLARRIGASRLIVNGSFTTDVPEPNDVDCVLLVRPESAPDEEAEEELMEGLPFIALEIVGENEFAFLVERFFATDRRRIPKGVIEVAL